MAWYITITAQLIRAGKRAYERKWGFLGVFALVFIGSILILGKLDLLPEIKSVSVVSTQPAADATSTSITIHAAEDPVRITIPTIGLAASVANPTTTGIEALDEYLLKGAVRYPTSAKLGEMGNVVLFGHSSYLPVVGNQAYKTFNDIQKLAVGDEITVSSAGAVYTYRVRNVSKASAEDAGISLATDGRVLTLATCNSFGKKSDRFIVVADFVESHVIPL